MIAAVTLYITGDIDGPDLVNKILIAVGLYIGGRSVTQGVTVLTAGRVRAASIKAQALLTHAGAVNAAATALTSRPWEFNPDAANARQILTIHLAPNAFLDSD